jgi:hypothetical protein
MSSCRPEPWLTRLPESPPFSHWKSLALLEYNKLESTEIANYFSPSLE